MKGNKCHGIWDTNISSNIMVGKIILPKKKKKEKIQQPSAGWL